ncbi:acyl-CoA dehydrogenase family protein [Candidatus Chlorohelix sp.]|uniref:acyl-CoA dehydrogenase family protein n=1 Tax=Candidatus Chlorohelix sp. TaxID=3139201 RepID=UPI00304235FB
MISFAPTEEQQAVIDTIRRFSRDKVSRARHDADENNAFAPALVQEGWRLGIVGGWLPEEFGGLGEPHSAISAAIYAEELAYGDLALALQVLTPALFGLPMLKFGSDAQKARWLSLLGEDKQPALTTAFTENGWSFDPNSMKTTARREGDDYILDGVKVRVANAEGADAILVYANENGATQAFIVEKGTEGLQISQRESLMGLRALPTYGVTLNGCRVPATARLGEDNGCDIRHLLNVSRVTVAGLGVGVARIALEHALEYAKQRQAFGKFIAQFQSIAFMLAEMQMEVDSARLMTWEAAWNLDKGNEATRECVLGFNYANDTVMTVADRAVQIWGGHGYIRENPVEQLLRNARAFASLTGAAML